MTYIVGTSVLLLSTLMAGCFAADDGSSDDFNHDELNCVEGKCDSTAAQAQVMKRGDSGPDVLEMQGLLLNIGYELDVDGQFGPATEAIVANFQSLNRIQVTKQVGATTLSSIRKVAQTLPKAAPLLLPDGYFEVTMATTRVLNDCKIESGTKARDDRPGTVAPSTYGDFDLVVNGTFSQDDVTTGESRSIAVGSVVRGGVLEGAGVTKASGRGGTAILKDGSVRIIRQRGVGLAGIQSALGTRVLDGFIGGGALLIENGQLVSSDDLLTRQRFDQGAGGLRSSQMFASQHTLVAIDAKGLPHIVLSIVPKSAIDIGLDLMKAGVINAVKFDGSSGFIARSNTVRAIGGGNGNACSGFAVKIRN